MVVAPLPVKRSPQSASFWLGVARMLHDLRTPVAEVTVLGNSPPPVPGSDEFAPSPHQHTDHNLYLAADRPGGAELAPRLRCRQSLQPRRRLGQRFSLANYSAGVATDSVLPPELWRDRHF